MHQAIDPREKIHALLSLIKNSSLCVLIPDYNITANALFQKTSKTLFEDTGMEVLNNIDGNSNKRTAELPSWCRDVSGRG